MRERELCWVLVSTILGPTAVLCVRLRGGEKTTTVMLRRRMRQMPGSDRAREAGSSVRVPTTAVVSDDWRRRYVPMGLAELRPSSGYGIRAMKRRGEL